MSMVVYSQAPLRVSLAGGGSDIPAFYQHESGMVVSMAITLHVRVVVGVRPLSQKYRLAYSQVEEVDAIEDLRHDLARACLRRHDARPGMEVATMADVPAGTGLGSSSAFTVALLAALNSERYRPWYRDARELAEAACAIELGDCGRAVGKQDAYASAVGGFNRFRFNPDGTVEVEPLVKQAGGWHIHTTNFLLLYTGIQRDASAVLAKTDVTDSRERATMRAQANLAGLLWDDLTRSNWSSVGDILNASWALKRGLRGVTDDRFDSWHRTICSVGGTGSGAKLCGAGGGGCFVVYAPRERHREIVEATGLQSLGVQVNRSGVRTETLF